MRGVQLTPAGRQRVTEAIKSNVSLHISLSTSHAHIHSFFPLSLHPYLPWCFHQFLPSTSLLFFSVYSPSFSSLTLTIHITLVLPLQQSLPSSSWYSSLHLYTSLHLSSNKDKVTHLQAPCGFINKKRLDSVYLFTHQQKESVEQGVNFQSFALS